jgi:hypothetical protein
MGVFVELFTESGLRDFTRHGVPTAAKDRAGPLGVGLVCNVVR